MSIIKRQGGEMDERLDNYIMEKHEQRLNDHSKRLDRLEQDATETRVKLDNLCEKIGGLTKALYGVCGLLATTIVGILAYGIQQILF